MERNNAMNTALGFALTISLAFPAAARPADVVYRGKPLADYVAAAKDSDPAERAAALRAIGQFGADGTAALPLVTEALGTAEESVRQAAAETIALFGPAGAPAVPALAPLLADPEPRTRIVAALALREIGPAAEQALPQLIAALKDDDLVVRMTVGLAIGNFGQDAAPAVKALIEAGNDRTDDWVSVPLRDMRRAVAWALGEIGPAAKEALPSLREWGRFYRVKWYTDPAIAKIEGKPAPPTWR
jgi:HEAT repeat protein